MKQFAKHLSFATLADYAEGGLDNAQRAAADTHLSACETCRATLGSVQRMVAALRSDELQTPPPYAVARALNLFRPLAQPASTGKLERRSLLGLLRFDSGTTLAFGMRTGSVGQTPARQLFFTLDEFDLDLRLEPGGNEWVVAGQLLGGEAVGSAALIGAEQRYHSELSELGEFTFVAVDPGVYHLLIALPAVDLSIPDLPVGV